MQRAEDQKWPANGLVRIHPGNALPTETRGSVYCCLSGSAVLFQQRARGRAAALIGGRFARRIIFSPQRHSCGSMHWGFDVF